MQVVYATHVLCATHILMYIMHARVYGIKGYTHSAIQMVVVSVLQ